REGDVSSGPPLLSAPVWGRRPLEGQRNVGGHGLEPGIGKEDGTKPAPFSQSDLIISKGTKHTVCLCLDAPLLEPKGGGPLSHRQIGKTFPTSSPPHRFKSLVAGPSCLI